MKKNRRVVITGIGVVAAIAIGQAAFWQATSQGISGIKNIERFASADLPIQVAGEVSDFVAEHWLDRKLAKRTDRTTHFALLAAQEALQDANLSLDQENPNRVGAVIANSLGGIEYIFKQMQALHTRGPRAVSAFSAISWFQAASAGQLSTLYGLQGFCKALANDAAGGLTALGMAYEVLQRGAADVLLSGGCEAFLAPLLFTEQANRQGIWANGVDPCAYRPFDRRATGLIPAEGAGICLLETYEHAQRRGAPIYGEIVGFAQTNDAHSLTAPPSAHGRQYARALAAAMQMGQLQPQDLSYCSLDGRAQLPADQGEREALHLAFGNAAAQLPVSVPRTMLGHSYAAAGALDTITALLSLRHHLIPPTINCEELDPRHELNLVQGEARPSSQPAVLIGGRSLGGANVALAVRT